MDNRWEILRLLADGRWHSGQELADQVGISRTAVWKQLGLLKQRLGIQFHSVRGRGYRLPHGIELLDEVRIREALSALTNQAIPEIEIHKTIDSTNSYLMSKSSAELRSGSICLAERQSEGRGRRGRNWVSPFGNNIYLSMFWRYGMAPAGLSGISLAAGLALIRTLKQLGVTDVGLKWPNDVLHRERKLAGLLLEVTGEQSGPSNVVVGLGLNVRLAASDGEAIDQPWVDLANVPGGKELSRNHIVATLLEHLVAVMMQFENGGLDDLVDEWHRHDLYCGKPIRLRMGDRYVEGVHRGIDRSGAILVEGADGVKAYHGGEVSLRSA